MNPSSLAKIGYDAVMTRIVPLLFLAVLIDWLGIHPAANGSELSPRDIAERNFYASKIPHVYTESRMTLVNDKGQQRIRKMMSVSVLQANGNDSNIMIRFLFPTDVQGTAYLQMQHTDGEDDMWIYLPALKKVRRLVANNKRDSFVGSDFSYGDILLPVVDTYRYTILRSELLEGEDCWVLESIPANDQIKKDYGYGRRVAWVRKSNFMEKRVEYFDPAGRPLKTQLVPEVKEVDSVRHKWLATHREVMNHQTGHRTTLVLESIDTVKRIPDDFFTPRYLERER